LILDTNALSALSEGDSKLRSVLNARPSLSVPVIVLGEFEYGILRSRRSSEYQDWLASYLPAFDILDVSRETARYYAQIRRELQKAGKPIPANDLWIAALGRQHQLAVVTRDKHFQYVQGLETLTW
jgi:predicted nucleic acid-binding protein